MLNNESQFEKYIYIAMDTVIANSWLFCEFMTALRFARIFEHSLASTLWLLYLQTVWNAMKMILLRSRITAVDSYGTCTSYFTSIYMSYKRAISDEKYHQASEFIDQNSFGMHAIYHVLLLIINVCGVFSLLLFSLPLSFLIWLIALRWISHWQAAKRAMCVHVCVCVRLWVWTTEWERESKHGLCTYQN